MIHKIENKIKTCQKHMLELLKFLHSICEKNNIKYTLEAGTLIGAKREKGFIPWDDDSDVTFVREEYEKFVEALEKEKLPTYIGVYYPEEKKEFLDFNLRLYHKDITIRDDELSKKQYDSVFSHPTLDIYVMDHVPESAFKRRIFVLWQQIAFGLAMSRRNNIKYKKYGVIERIAIFILSKIGKLFLLKSIFRFHDSVSKKYLNADVNYLYCTGWIPEFPGFLYKKEQYEKVHLTDFEDTKLYAIDDYDEVLTYGYGNWRTPKKTHDHEEFIKTL